MAYPTLISPLKGMEEWSEMKTIKTTSEANYTVTRSRTTKRRRYFKLNYPLMLLSEYQTLRTYFEGTAYGEAVSFSWTNPIDSVTYTVKYQAGTLKCTYYCNLWVKNVSFVLGEA